MEDYKNKQQAFDLINSFAFPDDVQQKLWKRASSLVPITGSLRVGDIIERYIMLIGGIFLLSFLLFHLIRSRIGME
jgi:hypothetical protein